MSDHSGDTRDITISLLGASLKPGSGQALLCGPMGAVQYRDAFGIRSGAGIAWLFDYGVLVSWNLSGPEHQALCQQLGEVIEDRIDRPQIDQFDYAVAGSDQQFCIQHDLLLLQDEEVLTTLALSHAFAQSAKLEFFEEQARDVIQTNSYISKQLASSGKVSLSRRDLARLRGVLFDTSSDITLHFGLLDTPEFFWDYPELEPSYLKLARYLDLLPRIDIINRKLETIHGLLEMIAAEQYHKHSSFLEWVIIVLIAVEIVMYLLD